MITSEGKKVITKFFSGQVGRIGDEIAIGTGTVAPALTDTALHTETIRFKVTSVSADTANSRIVFKGILPPLNVASTINEVGLFQRTGTTSTLVARTVLSVAGQASDKVHTEIEYSLSVTV